MLTDTTANLMGPATLDAMGPLNDPAIFRPELSNIRTAEQAPRFDSALRRALGGDQMTQQSPREAAEEFIAMALVQPVLAQLRETNQAAGPFAPGDVEKRFGPMLDAEIAHRMVKSSGWGLVDAVASRLDRGAATRNTPQEVDTDA